MVVQKKVGVQNKVGVKKSGGKKRVGVKKSWGKKKWVRNNRNEHISLGFKIKKKRKNVIWFKNCGENTNVHGVENVR